MNAAQHPPPQAALAARTQLRNAPVGPILVVDGNPIARRIARYELAGGAYSVVEAPNGAEALSVFVARRPVLVTLAAELADMSGFEACARLRTLEAAALGNDATAQVPVVVLAANDTPQGRERAFAVGAGEFLATPFAPGALRRLVDASLRPTVARPAGKALVVADAGPTRNLLVRALNRLGVRALHASDVREAQAVARQQGDAIGLIVADLTQPGLDADALYRELRRERGLADVPFVVLGGPAEQERAQGLIEAGAADSVRMPFSMEGLREQLQKHLV